MLVVTVLIAISAGRGTVQAESFGIKLLGNSAATVSSSAGVVWLSGWTNIATATFASGTIRSSDGSVSAVLTRSGPGRTNLWHSGSAADGRVAIFQSQSAARTLSSYEQLEWQPTDVELAGWRRALGSDQRDRTLDHK